MNKKTETMNKKTETVCSMCGDVGFSDKLFRCSNCRDRFQHSYCSNYYRGNEEAIKVCDWCRCDENHSRSGEKIRKRDAGKTTTRKYKLLKDVM